MDFFRNFFILFVIGAFLTGCAGPIVSINQNYNFDKIKRVAVLGFEDFPQNEGSGKLVSGAFEKALLQSSVMLVERRQVEAILKEQKLDVTGAMDAASPESLGKLLNVDALVLGTLTVYSPEKRGVMLVDIQEDQSEPIFKRQSFTRKRGTDTWVTTEREVIQGYNRRSKTYQMPQTYTLEAEVGASVRMVDVKTGEILWVGTSSQEAINTQIAAEIIARRIMKALKKTWPTHNLVKKYYRSKKLLTNFTLSATM